MPSFERGFGAIGGRGQTGWIQLGCWWDALQCGRGSRKNASELFPTIFFAGNSVPRDTWLIGFLHEPNSKCLSWHRLWLLVSSLQIWWIAGLSAFWL